MNIPLLIGGLKRWFGMPYTQYQPGTGCIVAARNDSASGVQITLETAMSIPAILHGLRTVGQTIGILDFDVIHHLIDRNAEGIEQHRQEIARLHPVHRLLHSEPNEFQNASEWRETMTAHAMMTGNGISYIERNGNFRPTALLPLLPNRTRAVIVNGELTYKTVVNGNEIDLNPMNVFHIKGFSWNGVSGLPILELMKTALGLDLAQTHFASKFYNNGANMGGVVEMAGALSDTARQNLKSSVHREYEGIGNAFRTLFLEEGMKYTKIGVEPDKAQFIEGRRFSLEDMSRVLGIAPHIMFNLQGSTNNNIEWQGITSITYTFEPWTNKFCQEANRKLLYESEKFDYSCRMDLKKLLARDAAAQATVDNQRFTSLAITPNEIRAKDGRNPIEGGDSLFLNTAYLPLEVAIARANAQTARITAASNTAPAITPPPVLKNEGIDDEADEGDNTPPGDPTAGVKPADGIPGPEVPAKLVEDERSLLRLMVRDKLTQIVKRESKAVESALKKHPDQQSFRTWYAGWEHKQRQHMAEVLQPVSKAAAAAGQPLSSTYIEQHLSRSREDVETLLNAPQEQRGDAQWSVMSNWLQDRIEQSVKDILGGSENAKAA